MVNAHEIFTDHVPDTATIRACHEKINLLLTIELGRPITTLSSFFYLAVFFFFQLVSHRSTVKSSAKITSNFYRERNPLITFVQSCLRWRNGTYIFISKLVDVCDLTFFFSCFRTDRWIYFKFIWICLDIFELLDACLDC